MNEDITDAEREKIGQYYSYGAPLPEEKHNVHSFLHKVATSDDTTKVGNLTSDELGMPRLTLRTYKDLSLISTEIMGNEFLGNYYAKQAEILTSTSLSKDAKLISLAVLQKRQIEDVTKPKKENKGWFKKKEDNQEVEGGV